jgi:hypothetical protein
MLFFSDFLAPLQLGKRWAEMNYQCCQRQHAKTKVANQRHQLFIGWMVYGYTHLFYSYKIQDGDELGWPCLDFTLYCL